MTTPDVTAGPRCVTDDDIKYAWRVTRNDVEGAAMLGIARTTFTRRRNYLHLPRKRQVRVSDDDIILSYQVHGTYREGGEAVGMRASSFRQRCILLGLPPKHGDGAPRTGSRVPSDVLEARLAIHRKGRRLTLDQAASQAGMSKSGYFSFLERYDQVNRHKPAPRGRHGTPRSEKVTA